MSHSTDDSRPAPAGKPTLEMLLRLKRSERPDADFWNEFERGLRQKQLAAIIEPKPWWLGVSLLARRLAPAGLPISAAAAALFAVMVVRTQSPLGSSAAPVRFAPAGRVELAAAPAPRPTTASAPIASSAEHAAAPSISPAPAEVAVASLPAVAPASGHAASAAPAPVGAETSAPVVASLLELPAARVAAPTPSEVTIAENLAAVRAEAPELLADAVRLEPAAAVSSSNEAVDIGALKMEVRNPRHARVLLAMAENSAPEADGDIAPVRDRTVRSLAADDALSGSSRRLVSGGDRLSLSF